MFTATLPQTTPADNVLDVAPASALYATTLHGLAGWGYRDTAARCWFVGSDGSMRQLHDDDPVQVGLAVTDAQLLVAIPLGVEAAVLATLAVQWT
jgi:hypothetical protein